MMAKSSQYQYDQQQSTPASSQWVNVVGKESTSVLLQRNSNPHLKLQSLI